MPTQNKAKKARGGSDKPSWRSDVWGIAMIGFGLLLLLALISFDYQDVPEWMKGPENDADRETSNWIGILGAMIAWIFLQLIGAASFLISLGLIWLGSAYCFMDGTLTKRTWIGLACFVVIGACLLSVTEWWSAWASHRALVSSGGVIGNFLGTRVFENLLNKTGAFLVLFVGYLMGLIMLTGLNPIKFAKLSWQKFHEWKDARTVRRAKQKAKSDAKQDRIIERNIRAEERLAAKEETKQEAAKKKAAEKEKAKEKAVEEEAKIKEED